MNVARASSRLFGTSIVTTVVSFAALTAFARALGPAEMGIYFLFQGAASVLGVGVDLGVGTAVETRVSEDENPSLTFSTGLAIRAALFAVVGVGILVAGPLVDEYVGAPVAPLLVVGLAIKQCNRLLQTTLRGEKRVGELAELKATRQFVRIGVAGALVLGGLEAVGLIAGTIVGTAVSALWAAVKLDTPLSRPTRGEAAALLAYAKYNLVPTIGMRVHSWLDILVIGWLLSASHVGAYEIAWRVAGVTTMLANAVSATVLPQTSAWRAESDMASIEGMLTRLVTPAVALIIPAVAGTLLLAPEILGIVFGTEYAVAATVLVVLVAGKVPEAIQELVGKCLLGLDRPDFVARATLVTIVSNLALNVVLVAEFGMIGAAVATVASYLAGLAFRIRYLRTILSLRFPWRRLGWCTGSAVVMSLVVYQLRDLVSVTSAVELVAVVAAGATLYLLLLAAYPPIRRDGRQSLASALP